MNGTFCWAPPPPFAVFSHEKKTRVDFRFSSLKKKEREKKSRNCFHLRLFLISRHDQGWRRRWAQRAREISSCNTYIQVFHRNGYVCICIMQSSMHFECVIWKFSIWPGQRSCTWPIFASDITLDLKDICDKFHHSTSTPSWVIVRTDGQTDRRTYKTIP